MNVRHVTCFLVLLFATSMNAQEVKNAVDKPTFQTRDQSVWGPYGGVTNIPFKEDLINIANDTSLDTLLDGTLDNRVANYVDALSFVCPAGTNLDIGTGKCYSCDAGFDPVLGVPPSLAGACKQVSNPTTATYQGDGQFLCPAGQSPDIATGKCVSCPSGYSNVAGTCTQTLYSSSSYSHAIGCPAGSFNGLNGACYTCGNLAWNPALPYYTSGVCYSWGYTSYTTMDQVGTWSYQARATDYFPWFEIYSADSTSDYQAWNFTTSSTGREVGVGGNLYKCPAGWNWNPAVPLNANGICYKWNPGASTTASYSSSYGTCSASGQIDNLVGSCYSCPTGYTWNGLPIGNGSECVKTNTSQPQQQGDITLGCASGQFLDLATSDCYQCPGGYDHFFDKGASEVGVCAKVELRAGVNPQPTQFLCPAGSFAANNACYSCDADYVYNPLVPVDQNGACFKLTFGGNGGSSGYQLGMKTQFDFKFRWGISGGVVVDEGSMDIDYKPQISLRFEKDTTYTGAADVFVVGSAQVPGQSALDMKTTWPAVELYADTYIDAFTKAHMDFYYPGFTETGLPTQEIEPVDLIDVSTNGEKTLDADPMIKMKVSSAGLAVFLTGDELFNVTDGFDPPIELAKDLFPWAQGPLRFGVVLAEIGLTFPDLKTPAPADFNGVSTNSEVLGVLGKDTYVEHKLQPGNRTGFGFGIYNGGAKETDALRLDLDLDGLYAQYSGSPLGIKVKRETPIPLVNYWAVNGSYVDIDAGLIFGFTKDVKFEPNLVVDYNFSTPVAVEMVAGSGNYSTVSSITLPLGETRRLIHPGGTLSITTNYSLRNNVFTNDTDLVLSTIAEGEIMSLAVDVLGAPPELPRKITAATLTGDLVPETIKLADLSHTAGTDRARFDVKGFSEVPGTTLSALGSNQPPVAACKNISVQLDNNNLYSLLPGLIDDGSSDPDAANGDSITLSTDVSQFSCINLGQNTVTLTATDSYNVTNSCTSIVTIADVNPPSGVGQTEYQGSEGGSILFDGRDAIDACSSQVTLSWDFGNNTSGSGTSATAQYCESGTYNGSVTVTDPSGNASKTDLVINVANVAPVVSAGAVINITEGGIARLRGAVYSDKGDDTHLASVNWGDNSPTESVSLNSIDIDCGSGGSISGQHVYTDNGTYTVEVRVVDDESGISSATTTVNVANAAPSVNAGDDVSTIEGSSVTFGGSYTDAGDDTHTISWDFGDNSGASGTLTPAHTYADNGTYVVKLTVTDDDGGVGVDTLHVVVANAAPVVSAGPDVTVDEGSPVSFNPTFTDAGDDTHTVFWNFGDGSSAANVQATSHTYVDNGVYTAVFTVTDDDGASGSGSVEVTVNNVAPTVDVGLDQASDEGDTVSFVPTVSDPGDDELSFVWDFGDNSVPATTQSAQHIFADNGTYTVSLTVTDDDNGSTTDVLTVIVNNVAPIGDAGPDQIADEGSPVGFAGTFTDPGADTFTFAWDFGDGSAPATTQSARHTYADNGEYTVSFTVTDDDEGASTDVLTVIVNNVAPTTDAGDDLFADEGSAVVFAPTITDPGADTFTVSWDYGDGNVENDVQTIGHVYVDNGVYTATFTVVDDDGGMAQDSVVVTVNNVAPIGDAGPDQVADEGSPVAFAGTYVDPGADEFTFIWDFGDGSGPATTQAAEHTYADNGDYQVSFTVTDDDGGTHTDVQTVTVLNVAPVAAAGADQDGDEGSLFTFEGSFTDVGDDTHTFAWNFGDGSEPILAQASQHTFVDNGTYDVSFTVTDDDGGSHTDILTVNVRNVAPVAEAGDDQATDEGTAISFSASYTDVGDDTHTVLWDFGDGETSDSLTPVHAFADDGQYTVNLIVTDDDGGIGVDSLIVNVANVAPAVTLMDDQVVDEGSAIVLTGSYSDPGADTHSVSWDLGDGTIVDTGSVANVNHVYADNGVYDVVLTVTDDDGGATSSAMQVVVNNVAPVALAGDNQASIEGSLVQFAGTYIDPGADTQTLGWDFGDGTSGVGANPAHTYVDNGVYTVSLVVTDDDGGIGHDSLTVTVSNAVPVINAIPDKTLTSGDTLDLTATFADVGLADTHTASVVWADGGEDTLDVNEGGGSGSASGSHRYLTLGTHNAVVTVIDNDGAATSFAFNVTVNPEIVAFSANGNVSLNGNGVTPAAILSSSTFDARDVVPGSIAVGPAELGIAHGGHLDDVNNDGMTDLVIHFRSAQAGLSGGTQLLVMTATTRDGRHITGAVSVTASTASSNKKK